MARFFWVTVTCALIVVSGCKKQSSVPDKDDTSVKLEPRIHQEGEPPTVLFNISLVSAANSLADTHVYECTYEAGGRTARFRLRYKQSGGQVASGFPVAFAEGSFLSVVGSENSVLLEHLKLALEAKELPRNVSRTKELQFDAAILGKQQSRDASGGYSDRPKGDWTLLKVFLPKEGDEGEVFLNINPVLGKGEFSIKDSDYGDYVLGQLARVL
jgi:hypothetical protein